MSIVNRRMPLELNQYEGKTAYNIQLKGYVWVADFNRCPQACTTRRLIFYVMILPTAPRSFLRHTAVEKPRQRSSFITMK